MQTAIIMAAVALAAGLMIFRLRRALRGGGCSCGCSSCGRRERCATKEPAGH
ncbi:MAG: FeoB-associated Cys-rich membrane protein [Desulfovibrionaceae bacterium]|nr:FeoB-associated Cys-rich membrane protein [Desulfovibrionaceae bacterium]